VTTPRWGATRSGRSTPPRAPRTGFAYLDEPHAKGAVLAMAHRGGALHPDVLGLENTMLAFRSAVGLGYRYLETDVHATKDGEVVAFHDAGLERVTGLPGRLPDLTYDEVAGALVGGREPIPRLVDLLEEFPAARFNVDLKSPEVVDPMIELVVRTGAQDRLCVGSFVERVLRRFRRRYAARSSVALATSCGIVAAGVHAFVPGGHRLQPLLRDAGLVYQAPVRFRERVPVVDRRFVERAHAIGRHVHVWTVDERAEMERLLDLGVDGLITDRTDVLREVLVERGQWEGAR
jgi:glycerophosphoryl diester phosphodiesterase